MKILAIRFARLGDVILLLPALASLKDKFPNSELTLMTGHRCAPLAELCPAIDRVIAVDRVAMRDGPVLRALLEMATLMRDVRKHRFDMVVDFHSFRETNLLTWLSGAPVRLGMKRHNASYLRFCFNRAPVVEDKSLHVSEMFQKIVESLPSTSGKTKVEAAKPLGRLAVRKRREPTVAFFVDAPVPERIWPPEYFAEIADFAIEKWNAAVIVISSNERPDLASRVQKACRHPDRLSIFTNLTLPELARVIASADLLVSNDTGPMHIGPAVGVRTLGLFSVGYPEHFKPIGSGDRYLRGNPIEEIAIEDVIETVEEMWATVDRGLRR